MKRTLVVFIIFILCGNFIVAQENLFEKTREAIKNHI